MKDKQTLIVLVKFKFKKAHGDNESGACFWPEEGLEKTPSPPRER